MRPRILLSIFLTALFVLLSGCGNVKNCPVCGTTTADGYAIINAIPVPEHNPNGEPGGPFNSFDISWVDPVNHLDYISDRLGLAVVVIDTNQNIAVNAIQGVQRRHGCGQRRQSMFSNSRTCIESVLGRYSANRHGVWKFHTFRMQVEMVHGRSANPRTDSGTFFPPDFGLRRQRQFWGISWSAVLRIALQRRESNVRSGRPRSKCGRKHLIRRKRKRLGCGLRSEHHEPDHESADWPRRHRRHTHGRLG